MKTKFTGTIEFEVEYPKSWKIDPQSIKWLEEKIRREVKEHDSDIYNDQSEIYDDRRPSKVKVKIKKL